MLKVCAICLCPNQLIHWPVARHHQNIPLDSRRSPQLADRYLVESKSHLDLARPPHLTPFIAEGSRRAAFCHGSATRRFAHQHLHPLLNTLNLHLHHPDLSRGSRFS